MSEWWASFIKDTQEVTKVLNEGFPVYSNEELKKVEIRPLDKPPCPWELEHYGWASIRLDRLIAEGSKYCPRCGRRLPKKEEK